MPKGVYKHKKEVCIKNLGTGKLGLKCPHTEEAKKRIGDALGGKKKPPRSENYRKHISESQKIHSSFIGKKGVLSPVWRGGKSFEEYTVDWKSTLKISIRERDHYTCGICGLPQGDEALCVHHIDYNKQNCNPDNLISLHRECHLKLIIIEIIGKVIF